jgi:MFS family permease
VVRAIHGLGFAAVAPVSIALVVDLAPAAQRGKALGWYTASTQSGLMIGPVIGGFLLSRFGFETTFYACSAVSLIGLVFIISQYAAFPRRHVMELTIDISWTLLRQRLVLAALLSTLLIAVGGGTIGAYIPLYARDSGITETGIGFIITASYISSALLRVPAGMLSDKLGRKPLIIGGLAVCAISIACISLFHGLAQLSITALCIGLGWGLTQPSAMALAADLSPTERRGLAMGSFACAFQIGHAVGPTAMGFVSGISNLETMFLVCAAIIAIGSLLIGRLLYAR